MGFIEYMHSHRKIKILIIVVIVLLVLLLAIPRIVVLVGKSFTGQESLVRSDWSSITGELLVTDEENSISINEADIESDIHVIQLSPLDVSDEDFTYYDESVQQRIEACIANIAEEQNWSIEQPLAILNPYGTGSNGLYLRFNTDLKTQATYTISVEGLEDYTTTASDGFTAEHEFQIIGLVPGCTNTVTITLRGEFGVQRNSTTFTIEMPDTHSGYSTQLDYTEGESDAELSDGLYAMMRTNGYLGYGFFFDNQGVMRYEMILEGFGLDRILEQDDTIITCVSSSKIAQINGLGQVERVYSLDGYELHHDINYGLDGTIVALAEHSDSELVEDLVLEIDLETGEVTELIDFSDLMSDFREEFTRSVEMTDPFFWQEGEWDWIHINSLQFMEDDDSMIISSRETSSIIKVSDIHDDQYVDWIIADPDFWEGTGYEDLVLDQASDFKYQYGQHAVEYAGEGDEDGTYYLYLYDNNYYAISTRDDLSVDLEATVGTDLYSGTESLVYVYLVDENEGTFDLVESFSVPYSSIVSNAQKMDDTENWVVNSGVANVYGEYDEDGTLIREFSYDCDIQGYRTFKYNLVGFWFAE